MPQIFHRSFNTLSKVSVIGGLTCLIVLSLALYVVGWSPYVTQEKVARVQPVQFSHAHHVGQLGIDCRYCHTSVETTPFAGIPPTKTCMNCHQEIWVGASALEPVRASYRTGEPIVWERVHNLAQFAYFNHSIHINKGIGCASCHGRIDKMALTYQASPLTMSWCLSCHRAPEKFVRPRDQVFNMNYVAKDQDVLGPQLVKQYNIKSMIACSTCHY